MTLVVEQHRCVAEMNRTMEGGILRVKPSFVRASTLISKIVYEIKEMPRRTCKRVLKQRVL